MSLRVAFSLKSTEHLGFLFLQVNLRNLKKSSRYFRKVKEISRNLQKWVKILKLSPDEAYEASKSFENLSWIVKILERTSNILKDLQKILNKISAFRITGNLERSSTNLENIFRNLHNIFSSCQGLQAPGDDWRTQVPVTAWRRTNIKGWKHQAALERLKYLSRC